MKENSPQAHHIETQLPIHISVRVFSFNKVSRLIAVVVGNAGADQEQEAEYEMHVLKSSV